MTRETESGLPVEPVYRPGQPAGFDPASQLGEPGEYPYTRGIYPAMYTARPWTMRQYSGFSTAAESNRRYHQLIEAGSTGLSVAFDLPTQMGYDSDAPAARGEVGKVGVAIDSIDDMRSLLRGIPLESVSVSMTINAPASVLLLLYQLVAEEEGVSPDVLDRKSTRLNSSHLVISYAVFCLKKKKKKYTQYDITCKSTTTKGES